LASVPEVANPFAGAEAAEAYAAGRLDVHAEFARRIEWGIGGRARRALDLGCGTGLSTRPLGAIATEVVGLDASAPMLAEAARHGGRRWIRGRAEALPFPDGSFDLVTLGCAFHWCEPAALLAELRRVLLREGHLAVYDHCLQGRMEDEPRFDAWSAAYKRRFPKPPRHPHFAATAADGFAPVARERFEHAVPLTRERLVRYLLSQSDVLAAVAEGRVAREEAEADLLRSLAPFYAGRTSARLVYSGELDVLRPR
jgi:SAM-dependent methyltransferase